jgi:hypothetical protein
MVRCMQRTNIYLDERQVRELDRRARSAGTSRAAALRAVLDVALSTSAEALELDLAVLAEVAGTWQDDVELPARTSARDAHLDRLRRL